MTALSRLRSAVAQWFASPDRTPRGRRLALMQMEGRDVPSVGGGLTAGGLRGEYFDNPTLAGLPAFVRRDVRVDFDWAFGAPGGSTAPEYARVGADNFSVRWTGQVIPRFTETYTFRAGSDDGVRLWIRPAGTANWVALVDNWDVHAFETVSRSYPLSAGQTYDIRVEYYEGNGKAGARLTWASPSTPEEVIDPATEVGINALTYADHMFADATKMGRAEWGDATDYFNRPLVPLDGDGWPTADAAHIFWEGQDPAQSAGTYRLRFQGKAEVRSRVGGAHFKVGGRDIGGTLPAGTGYDAGSNTTTADVVVTNADLLLLVFRGTQRTAWAAKNTGVTRVQLLRPLAPGSGTSYPAGEVFDRATKDAFARFSALRFLTANFNAERDWWERKPPTAAKAAFADRAGVWEYQVMLANETGKDLYITVPINASDDYVRKLAKVIRYGSDGANPYDWPVGDPAYPGLNPNLRVYVEWGNEVWNWAFDQSKLGAEAGKAAVRANTPDGRAVNFDGQRPDGDFRRWAAVRTVRASDTFRSVFGDAAMGDTVRMLLEYQYDNHQGTAVEALRFIDTYFNNGDGQWHVPTPKPVNYYLWGAGGATYFGASNPRGLTDEIKVWDGGVENLPVAAGGSVKRPGGSAWQFTGDAGVYRDFAWARDNQTVSIAGVGPMAAPTAGAQAMYVSGGGTAAVTIDFPRAGWYALDFLGAGEPGMANPLDFYFDDQRVTPRGSGLTPSPTPWVPGVGRDPAAFAVYGTVPVWVGGAGRHTFKIVGRGTAAQSTGIDDVRVGSLDALFASNLPGGGQAAGQVSIMDYQQQLANQASYAQAYGLKVVAYEGGWSLGGDTGATPLMSFAKYKDARAAAANAEALTEFQRAGGALNVLGTYEQWERDDSANAADAPLVRGLDAVLRALPAEASTGAGPGTTGLGGRATDAASRWNDTGYIRAGDWVSWTVIAPATGEYTVSATTTTGGRAVLVVDGDEVHEAGSGGWLGGVVRLTKGAHAVRVQSGGGTFFARAVTVTRNGSAPVQTPAPAPVPTPAPAPPPTSTPAVSPGLPGGWRTDDVNSPSVDGSTVVRNGRWTVRGAGTDIWGPADQFQFAHTAVDGDTTVTARVEDFAAGHAWAKAGVILRNGTGPSSPFAAVLRTPGQGLSFTWRERYMETPQQVVLTVPDGPVWVRVVRRANTFAGFYSLDGTAWYQIGTGRTIDMPGAIRAGVAVTSHDAARTATATFTNVSAG